MTTKKGYVCGAATKSGNPCQRRVKSSSARCYQHNTKHKKPQTKKPSKKKSTTKGKGKGKSKPRQQKLTLTKKNSSTPAAAAASPPAKPKTSHSHKNKKPTAHERSKKVPRVVYWEKQDAHWCGLHTLNAILQEEKMNKKLAKVVGEGFDALEAQINAGEPNKNLDESGAFNIATLQGLLDLYGFNHRLEYLKKREIPTTANAVENSPETAFIINKSYHWYVIRKFNNGKWVNLNSTLKAPTYITPEEISKKLKAAKQVLVLTNLNQAMYTNPHKVKVRKPPTAKKAKFKGYVYVQ